MKGLEVVVVVVVWKWARRVVDPYSCWLPEERLCSLRSTGSMARGLGARRAGGMTKHCWSFVNM